MPECDPIPCPQCRTPIRMTLPGMLRAQDLGVAVECPECGGAWLFTMRPVPLFGPLNSPKRQRGRSRALPDDQVDDADRSERD